MPDLDGYKRLWAGPSREKANFIYGIAREVSKHAELSACNHDLRELARFLTIADMVYLYEQIRDISKRLEFEWRDSFIRYFPASRNSLPDIQLTREQYEQQYADILSESREKPLLNDSTSSDDAVPF